MKRSLIALTLVACAGCSGYREHFKATIRVRESKSSPCDGGYISTYNGISVDECVTVWTVKGLQAQLVGSEDNTAVVRWLQCDVNDGGKVKAHIEWQMRGEAHSWGGAWVLADRLRKVDEKKP